MRYGIISDIHFGYYAGNKVNDQGVNIREQDHYDAAFNAVDHLKAEGVDVIIDAGDMAEVPAPRKRALINLVELVRFAGVPFYSVDGNHTSLKSSNDSHVYDLIGNECENFVGIREPTFDPYTRISFVPHSYDNEELKDSIRLSLDRMTQVMVGHSAADDIPYVGQVSRSDLPKGIAIFLGHYHNYRPSNEHNPTYLGSTEKTAWDQWDYPTGCAVYDSDNGRYTRIEIPTREWVDINAGPDDYMDALFAEDITGKIARLTVNATPAEYNLVNIVAAKGHAREAQAANFTMRRKNSTVAGAMANDILGENGGLNQQWIDFAEASNVPAGVDRRRIVDLGLEVLIGKD